MKNIFILQLLVLSIVVNIAARDKQFFEGGQGGSPVPPEFRDIEEKNIRERTLAKETVSGDTTFKIRTDVFQSGTDIDLNEVEFYRKSDTSDFVNVYVEKTEYDSGEVTDERINDIVNILAEETPEGSINPDKGIYANMRDTLGQPSDVDGNNKLNVLLLDVRDDYSEGDENHVSGYFDPLDLKREDKGNYGEIIYIDTDPTDLTHPSTYTIVAHELQHLIHYTYDSQEETWLNEGLSVLMPRVLGLPYRSYSKFTSAPNRKLNTWDREDEKGVLLKDYQKVGLWSFYLYKRFGIDFISKSLQQQATGFATYKKITDVPPKTLLKDWYIANLINNSDIEDGKYSYQGEAIPEITTDHFSSSYTDGEEKEFELASTAAQYIQFYEGQEINFNLTNYDNGTDQDFGVVAIKQKSQPEISELNPSDNNYKLKDVFFGLSYDRISFIPYRNNLGIEEDSLDIGYEAFGRGGIEEEELVHDGDSVSFYINLEGKEAAEKFQMDSKNKSLRAVKFKTASNISDGTIKIYKDLDSSPIKVMNDISAAKREWKRVDFKEEVLSGEDSFVASVASDGALGYSATGNGENKSFINTISGFKNITEMELNNGIELDGNWTIRAVVGSAISDDLELYPDSLLIWEQEKDLIDTNFVLINRQETQKNWTITEYADWLNFLQPSGSLKYGSDTINITINKDKLKPGLYENDFLVNSTSGYISVIKRNKEEPQSTFFLKNKKVQKQHSKLKLFNIGSGESEFKFMNVPEALSFSNSSGKIEYNNKNNEIVSDTIISVAFIDTSLVDRKKLEFDFYNGIDTLQKMIIYTGETRSKTDYALNLFPAAPNPLDKSRYSKTVLRFRLPTNEAASLVIYNILGQKIKKYDLDNYGKGMNSVRWYGKNEKGIQVSSGVYIGVLKQNSRISTQKMLFIK